MIHLTIIRHGETVENAHNLCQGQQQGTLSDLGVRQAKLLAMKLQHEPMDAIYSSDLQRAINTAMEIIKFHPRLLLQTDSLLRERYLSSWEGKPFPDDWHWEYLPDGAESNEDMMSRARQFLQKIKEQHNGQRVVAVTHGGLIRAMRTLIAQKPSSEYFSWEAIKNTSVSCVEIEDDGMFRILEMNNTDHLDQATPDTKQEFS